MPRNKLQLRRKRKKQDVNLTRWNHLQTFFFCLSKCQTATKFVVCRVRPDNWRSSFFLSEKNVSSDPRKTKIKKQLQQNCSSQDEIIKRHRNNVTRAMSKRPLSFSSLLVCGRCCRNCKLISSFYPFISCIDTSCPRAVFPSSPFFRR